MQDLAPGVMCIRLRFGCGRVAEDLEENSAGLQVLAGFGARRGESGADKEYDHEG